MIAGERHGRPLGRILITGAGGFLGAALARRLRRLGVDPVASDVPALAATVDGLQDLDVTDAEAVNRMLPKSGFDTVFHCGAVSGPMVMPDQPDRIWRINVTGTVNLLEAARRAAIKRLVFCSSVDVYGSRTQAVLGEDAQYDPDTVYGASKAAAEQALLACARQHGLDGIALRFAWIYGPERRTASMIPRLLGDILAGREAVLDGAAGDLTHYMHVDDAVSALLAAARAETLPHRIYNATAGAGVTLQTLADQASALFPDARIRLTGGQPTRGPLGYDNSRAEREFGYAPQVAFREGLAGFADALRRK